MTQLPQVLGSVGHIIPAFQQVTSGLCSTNMFKMMWNIFWGVFLGLFVVVHPTPANTVTQIPATFEEDIYHQVKAEEFIVDPFTPRSVSKAQSTTAEIMFDGKAESHQTPVVFQESQQLPSDTMMVSSGESQTAPLIVPAGPTIQSVMDMFSAFQVSDQLLTDFTTEGSADPTSSTRLFEGSGFFPAASASRSVIKSTVVSDTTIQTPQGTFTDFFTEGSATRFVEGSGHSPTTTQTLAPTTGLVVDSVDASMTTEPPEISAAIQDIVVPRSRSRSFIQRPPVAENAGMDKLQGIEKPSGSDQEGTGMHKGHVTPDWIIIVGFIFALAALMAICAAIATRDKWNHPNQVSESSTNSSNQKREVEMQPIVHKVEPKVNGNNGDYTVIPLDDAPDDFPSD